MINQPEDAACEYDPQAALSPEERRRFQDPGDDSSHVRGSEDDRGGGLVARPAEAESLCAGAHAAGGLPGHSGHAARVHGAGRADLPDLASVPVPVDLALVFRPGPECLGVAEQAIAAGVPRIWFQLDIPAGEGPGGPRPPASRWSWTGA